MRRIIKKNIYLIFLLLVFSSSAVLSSCSGEAFEDYKKDRYVEDNPPTPDTIAPDIESAAALNGTQVKVIFSEDLDAVEANNFKNYYIQGNNRVDVTEAVLQGDNRSVILTLSNWSIYRMLNGKEYTLLVQKVSDKKLNSILNKFITFIGKGQVIAEIWHGSDKMPDVSPYPSYNTAFAEFTIHGSDISAYQYSFDDAPWITVPDVSTVLSLPGLTEGFHTLKVIGKNSSTGEWQDANQPTVTSFTIDTTPPEAVLSHLPANVTDIAEIDIVVSGLGVETYRYKINSESWSSDIRVNERIYRAGMPDGSYTIMVVGKDSAGNEQSSAVTHSWVINGGSSVAAPLNIPDRYTRMRNINIGVTGNNVNYYTYRFNGSGWSDKRDTGTNIIYSNLSDGNYTIDIIGSSSLSDDTNGPMVSYSFTIDNNAPVAQLSNLPATPTNSQSTHITVSSSAGDVVAYKYRINSDLLSGQYSSDTPIELTSLPEGTYTIKVMGIDAAGNIESESSAATWTWVVDLAPPRAVLSGLPSLMTSIDDLYVTVSGDGAIAYKYQIDNSIWTSELSILNVIDIPDLAQGYHTISVLTRDQAGNWQTIPDATSYTWMVDTIPPVAVLTDRPAPLTNIQDSAITVGGPGVSGYKYKLDSGVLSAVFDRIENPSIPLSSLSEGVHTISVIAVDQTGNWQVTPTTYTWTISLSVPTAVLSNTPSLKSTSSTISITVGNVDSYQYKLDDAVFWSAEKPVADAITASSLSEGQHILRVIGKNSVGLLQEEVNATVFEWTVDTSAPIAELSNKPEMLTNNQSAAFTVGGIGVYGYRYRLDNPSGSYGGEVILASDNVIEFTNLSGESHTLYVIARDEAGNWQNVPSTYTWVIDTTAPVAVLNNTPDVLTNLQTITITVTGPGVIAYKYSLDGAGYSAELNNVIPISRVGLGAGTHTLNVISKNNAGTWQSTGTPTSYTWTIDITGPSASDITLSNLPDNPTVLTSVNINVSGTGITKYQYRLNEGSWSTDMNLATPISLSGLSDNIYTIYVIAKDSAGNWLDRNSAKQFTWRVDSIAPLATITNRPDDPTSLTSADFDIGGAGIIEYKFQIDGGAWSSWIDVANNISISSLIDGTHTLKVCGSKGGGFDQAEINATTYTWKVDTIAPVAAISNLPVNNTTSVSVGIGVAGTDVIAYRYRIDGGSWLPALTDKSVDFDIIMDGLSVGTHTIDVKGRDLAGNWQSDSALTSYTWTIIYPPLNSPSVYDGGDAATNSPIQFSWINNGGTADVKIQIASDSNFTNIVYGGVNGIKIGNVNYFNFLVTDTEVQKYFARVSVNSTSGIPADDASWKVWGGSSDGINVVGGVIGTIKNAIGLTSISGATIRILKTADSSLVDTTTSDSNGDFAFNNIPLGTNLYKLEISAGGYGSAVKNNVTVALGADTSVGNMYLVPTGSTEGTITGKTVDANDGKNILSVTVKIYDYQGIVRDTQTSSGTGSFTTISLPAGVYSVLMTKSGYFDLMVDNVVVNGNKNIGSQAICAVLTEPQVRVIVLWGDQTTTTAPADLDMHLVGPTSQNETSDTPNNRFHIYWVNEWKSYNEANAQYIPGTYDGTLGRNVGDLTGTLSTASQVQDDTNSFGPESINLFRYGGFQYARGTYTYTLHRWSGNNGTWGVEPITMRVYDSGGMVREINFPGPQNPDLRYWKALKINIQGNTRSKRTLNVINQFGTLDYANKASMDW